MSEPDRIRWLNDLDHDDVPQVGGKNASLGEMLQQLAGRGVRVPPGFATTAKAYREFLEANDLPDRIRSELDQLGDDFDDDTLKKVGRAVRRAIRRAELPEGLRSDLETAYRKLCEETGQEEVGVAVRSSATAEDLPEASFAGQQKTFLNVTGIDELLEAVKECFASLFTDRAIAYREEQGFDHMDVALSAGVQKMVRADKAGSGVMFSIDTESGFPGSVVINAAWGLGELVVQGTVNPDEYRVFKPLLDTDDLAPILEKRLGAKAQKMIYAAGDESDPTKTVETTERERKSLVLTEEEILQLARWARDIEDHYQKPMDMEWAKDGLDDELYIVQARPETVQSQKEAGALKTFRLRERGTTRVKGLAIGQAIASGKALNIASPEERGRFEDGAVLVTGMTDPDWVPIMKRAAGIVTDHGGRTSHAAIVSRELGIPAVVGTEDATDRIEDGEGITLSCAEGDTGYVYEGELDYEEEEIDLEGLPKSETEIMMNIASPDASFRWWRLPANGIGLARMEFIINNEIKIHPRALLEPSRVEDQDRHRIDELTRGYDEPTEYFVETLARGIARIAAPHHPRDVIVRMSDFKTNEYADLIGGGAFEPEEANPMLGWRGASRYYSEGYRDGFALECRAIRRARDRIGLKNIVVMIPFCRTLEEADRVLDALAENGLERGKDDLKVYVMAEIPANIVLAESFAERFDGFSIGTNDLTQLVLGIDRDSSELSHLFDEENEAVKEMIRTLIEGAHKQDCKVGICGQAPSDKPDFAAFLVRAGIDSISLNPDSVVPVIRRIAELENE
jgi:pyruvate,water dikinase